ncbi:MAG: hypothetical protein ACFE8L_10620 [Candidatus Hodarchaeota archaeon]
MRNLKKSKQYVLILLITIPSLLALSSLMTNVQGGPDDIPVAHPDNAWHWEVAEGDQIYFEGEFILTNATTGEIYMMFRDIWIYNITDIGNVTIDAGYGVRDYSQINATRCYYNSTAGEIEAYDSYPQELALFGYHDADPIQHKYRAGYNGMAFVLPINDTAIDVDLLAGILNESFYGSPMYQMAFNSFDNYTTGPGNRIYFYNTSDHYFADAYYYDNGTLDVGTAYLSANMGGTGHLTYINATMKQVFDYNITDEVEWGVNVGDVLYYDAIENEYTIDDAMDMKLNITAFPNILFNKTKNGFSEEEPVYMVYQTVFADRFMWNGTDYEYMDNVMIGSANNFYPQYYDDAAQDGVMPFIWPINVPMEDIEFMWNNDTLRIWESLIFDEVYIYENGYYDFYLRNSTGVEYVRINVSKATGVAQSFLMFSMYNFMYFQLKTQTLVDWSVNIGDIIYYKENGEEFTDIRITILGTYTYYVNMTFLIQMYNSMGIPVTLPSGQPEYQFFSYLLASIERWDPSTESWDFDDVRPFAIANIYWPISPLSFEMGPPLLMPEGTTSSELTDIFDMFGGIYDEITYGSGFVTLRNSTLDRTLYFYFDEISGRVTMMYGWANTPGPGSEWNYMSYYPKFYEAFGPGNYVIQLESDFITDITIDLEFNVTIGGPGIEYIYNYFPMNPVNVSLPKGTPLGYFDQLIINYGLIQPNNITMTFTFPISIDLAENDIFFFGFNMSGTYEWDEAPPEFYDTIVYNYVANSLTLNSTAFGPRGMISAMSYKLKAPSDFTLNSDAGTPEDDDGEFTFTWDSADRAVNYSIYRYHQFISEINGSLILVAEGLTSLTYPLSGYANGTYYFVVVAYNINGDYTISNCIEIIVAIPPSEPSEEPIIPGYSLFMFIMGLIVISAIILKKRFK